MEGDEVGGACGR